MSVMTDSTSVATSPAKSRPARAANDFDWRLVVICFVLLALVVIAKAILSAKATPLIDDTDDAMRLNTVRDLLAGQSWWDHVQHRLNAPFGAEIHWSHLVDAGIAGVVLLLRPFAGTMTETIAVYAWPLLLLFGLLALSGRLTYRLAGREAMLPALVLPLLSPALIPEFSPGRIDHDSIQILLLLLMAWGSLEAITRPRFAILAGLAAAGGLAIGIEGLPSAVSAVVAIALIWVFVPQRADALRYFGLSFGLGTVAALVENWPPNRWFDVAFDEISIVYVAFAVGVGAVLVLLSVLPVQSWRPWQRLGLGGGLAAMLAMILAHAFPGWRDGPYSGLDPWLVHNWLDHISEAKPVWESLASAPAFVLGVTLPSLLGLVAIAMRVWRGPKENRGEWLVLGVFLAIAVIVAIVQVRGFRLTMPLALPAAGWLVAVARRRYLGGQRLSGILAMLGSWLGSAGLALSVIVVLLMLPFDKTVAAPTDTGEACVMPQAFTKLAALPPARIMAPIDLGSHLLLFTPHSVVGAPYQRDQAGVLDTYHFLNGPIGAARQILAARGVTLVVICPQMSEMRGLSDAAPDSLVKLFAAGRLPGWLTPESGPTDTLKVFAVSPS